MASRRRPAATARAPVSVRPSRVAVALLWRPGGVALAAMTALGVQAQTAGDLKYYVQSSISVSQTLTDNGRLDKDGQAEAITQVTPAVRVSARGPRVQGSIDYALNGVVYARESDRSTIQNRLSLNSSGGLELVENHLYLDASAQASQQLTTAFGQQTPGGLPGGDTTQVYTYTLSPYLVGRLGSVANLTARVTHSQTITPDASRFGATTDSAQLALNSGSSFNRLGWALVATRTVSDYDASRRTEADSVLGTLSYRVTPEFVVRASAGADWNDLRTVDKTRYDRYGVGFDWRPTVRTTLSAQVDDRYFGTGYNVTFQHRTPRTVWTLRASRDASEINGRGNAAVATVFDLLFAQFASIEPDPLKREQLVLAFLQANGIAPGTLVFTNVLFGAATLQETQSLSFALLGRRTTVTVTLTNSRTSRLDALATGIGDDFANTDFVRQQGVSVNLAHRLSPVSSASLALSQQHNEGELDTQRTRQRTVTLTWTTQTGRRSSLSLAARHVSFDSDTRPYTENALVGTFSYRFN
jgi:uncharacterized protein (PEP-CTERM system associated)